ncbi:MAG: HAD family hydrolase [Candidatus Helarchaeota archaeon]
MNFDAIFFDLGFTLIEIPNFKFKIYTNLLKKGLLELEQYLEGQGLIGDSHYFYNTARSIQKDFFKRYFKTENEYSAELILKNVFDKLNVPFDDDLITRSAKICHKYELKAWKLKKGVKQTLEELSKDHKMAIISNAIYHEGIIQILRDHDILEFFDVVLSSAKVGVKKPNRKIFLECIKSLNSNPNECLFVGDDIHADIYGAKQLNFTTIQIKRSFQLPIPKEINVTPDHEISEIPELLEILK